jgi:hypothetical protein
MGPTGGRWGLQRLSPKQFHMRSPTANCVRERLRGHAWRGAARRHAAQPCAWAGHLAAADPGPQRSAAAGGDCACRGPACWALRLCGLGGLGGLGGLCMMTMTMTLLQLWGLNSRRGARRPEPQACQQPGRRRSSTSSAQQNQASTETATKERRNLDRQTRPGRAAHYPLPQGPGQRGKLQRKHAADGSGKVRQQRWQVPKVAERLAAPRRAG